MPTPLQKDTAQAIVNIFETGAVRGRYGEVTLIQGDTGHLTYGRSQTTLTSGNLHALISRYCDASGAKWSDRLKLHLPRFEHHDLSLDGDTQVHNLLRAAADDPVMRQTQDDFFDDVYWSDALHHAQRARISLPLGLAVIYDSTVHGSWEAMRDRTNAERGSVARLGEEGWINAYLQTRRQWLAQHTRPDLRATVYRMDALMRLADQGYWSLELPLVVRGLEISEATMAALPPDCFDGPEPGQRGLSAQSPLPCGLDVRLMQVGLSFRGVSIKADGIFGQTSAKRVREYQASQGLPSTGIADAQLVAELAQF